jgi:hypothetical protein
VNDQSAERPRKPAPKLADYPHRVGELIRFGEVMDWHDGTPPRYRDQLLTGEV